jgi:hypothetical protein
MIDVRAAAVHIMDVIIAITTTAIVDNSNTDATIPGTPTTMTGIAIEAVSLTTKLQIAVQTAIWARWQS